jgi:hypothetical protein
MFSILVLFKLYSEEPRVEIVETPHQETEQTNLFDYPESYSVELSFEKPVLQSITLIDRKILSQKP